MNADPDRIIRRLLIASIALLVAGAVLFVAAFALFNHAMLIVLVIAALALIAGLTLRAIVLVDRFIRSAACLPPRDYSVFAPPTYSCPNCGYTLRGVRGPYCPECGTVRPAPIDGEDIA